MIRHALLIFACAMFSFWQWLVLSFAICGTCAGTMASVTSLQAGAPFAYRLLTPGIIVALGGSREVIMLLQFVGFVIFFALLSAWAQRWQLSPQRVLPVFAIVIAIMMPTYYVSLYTLPEWILLLWALLLLPRWSLSPQSTEK